MKLSYRGNEYEYNPLPLEQTPEEIGGCYRGAKWKSSYPRHIPVPQPAAQLKYRGVSYCVGDPLEVELKMLCRQQREAASKAVVNQSKKGSNELVNTHRSNIRRDLERRLQVAQEKGDQALVGLLEDEARQIV
jgi:hypothetical protein